MSSAQDREPVRFECPACFERIDVPFGERHSTFTCPCCGERVQLANHQVFWANLNRAWRQFLERRRAMYAARVIREQEATEAERVQQLALRRAQQVETLRLAHYEAVIAGRAFDAAVLAEEMKNDWVALQELGLTEVHIRQGFRAASPVAGVGSWLLGAPPWMAALIALGTYFASGAAGEEYVEGKLLEWRAKWARILGNLSEAQLWQLSQTLQQRYPMVYGSLELMSRMLSSGG